MYCYRHIVDTTNRYALMIWELSEHYDMKVNEKDF